LGTITQAQNQNLIMMSPVTPKEMIIVAQEEEDMEDQDQIMEDIVAKVLEILSVKLQKK